MTIPGIEQGSVTQLTSSSTSAGRSVTAVSKSDEESNDSRSSRQSVSQQDRVEISRAAQELARSESSSQQGKQGEDQSLFNRR